MYTNYIHFSFAITKNTTAANGIEKHVVLYFFAAKLTFGIQLQLTTTTQTRFVFSELIKMQWTAFVFVIVSGYGCSTIDMYRCTYRFAHFHFHVFCCANACLHVTFQTSSFSYVQCAACAVCVCCNYDYYCWYFFTIFMAPTKKKFSTLFV